MNGLETMAPRGWAAGDPWAGFPLIVSGEGIWFGWEGDEEREKARVQSKSR